MREKRTVQSSIFELYPEHEIGRDLEAMSEWSSRRAIRRIPIVLIRC